MKKSIKLAATMVALFGLEGRAIQLQKIDVANNQAKLYAANMKVHGGEIQIIDENHVGDTEYDTPDLRLMSVAADIRLGHKTQRSSLDDPVSDRTVSSVKPDSPLENAHRDWLFQRPPNSEHIQLNDESEQENDKEKQDKKNQELNNDFDLEISPTEVGYDQRLELQQAEQSIAKSNQQIDLNLAEKEEHRKKQAERVKFEEDTFVAEQAKNVEETIEIMTEELENKQRQQQETSELLLEDKMRKQKMIEYLAYEDKVHHPEKQILSTDPTNLELELSGINDDFGIFSQY